MKKIEVVAAIIINDQKVLAAQRNSGFLDGYFEFPGGKIEKGESQEQALVREINEELNIEVHINGYVTTVTHSYETFELTMHLYATKIISGEIKLNVHKSYLWLDKSNLRTIKWAPADIPALNVVEEML